MNLHQTPFSFIIADLQNMYEYIYIDSYDSRHGDSKNNPLGLETNISILPTLILYLIAS